MECVRCHTPLPDNSKFCFACGYDITGGGSLSSTSAQVESLMARLQRIVEGEYKLERLVGKGGMGAVFLAQDLTLDREVAIKVLPPDISLDEHVVKRFQQEAKTAAKLDHPNIIPIYRVESEGGLFFFVMKYIAGTSLEDVLDEKKRLPLDYVQRVLWEAACALGHAHQRSVVHRDVKPANIMFDHDGRVMLTDFGISKALQAASGFTGTGMIIGTPHYMAPEQAKGSPVDGRADQYSLGVVGYRMLTLELPFGGDSVHTILYKHIFEEPPALQRADVPEFLRVAIKRALAKEPGQRYANMEEFATAVWPEQPVAAPGSGKSTPRPRPKPAATAESPTELTPAPAPATPPLAAKGKVPVPAPKKKGGKGLFVGAAVAAIAAGGYFVVFKGGAKSAGTQNAPPPQQTQTTNPSANPAVHQTPETTAAPVQTPPPQVRTKSPASPPRREPRREPQPRPQTQAPAAVGGLLTISTDPIGAEVYIDGVDVGQTPIVEYSVAAGKHTIKVERAGYKMQTETVTVGANDTVRRKFSLIAE
jgi:serine/threonine-protein kinase